MAIAKARAAEPVRGYHMTTIHTGRVVKASGKGFGLPRLGGLINGQIEGLTTPSTGGTRLATPKGAVEASQTPLHGPKADEQRLQEHREWKQGAQRQYKETDEQVKRAEEINEQVSKKAEQEKGKPKAAISRVELVEGRPTAADNAPAEVLDDPKHLAEAEEKSLEEQKAEAKQDVGDLTKPRPDVKPAEGQVAPAEKPKTDNKK